MNEVYLGLDLCRKYIQLSYFCEGKDEPESIFQLNNTETYQLPNVMFYSVKEQKWYIGNQVKDVQDKQNGILVKDLLQHIDSSEHVLIEDKDFTYEELLLLLLKLHIEAFLKREDEEEKQLVALAITLENYQPKVYQVLQRLREELGFSEDQFYVMSHENAFFQYMMHQDERLRTNSVAMFEYGKQGMHYYRIDKKQQGGTAVYLLDYVDLHEEIPYSLLIEDTEKLDKVFAENARTQLQKTFISTVYLTGQGFNEEWIKESTKVLCAGRRVFLGQNIYTKGACYQAKLLYEKKDYGCVLCEGKSILYDIGVSVGEMEGRNHVHLIAAGGREWYNTKGKATLFLDETNRIDIVYQNKVTKEIQKEVIEIHGLPKRPPKTTKISIEIEMLDEKTGAIVIRDVGFGKIYPTTRKIYRKEFTLV